MFSDHYGSSGSPYQPYAQQPHTAPLQFYNAKPSNDFLGARPSLDGHVTAGAVGGSSSFGGNIQPSAGWWSAFGTGGLEGEPPLLEGKSAPISPREASLIALTVELGINFSHIRARSMTVLNPLRRIDEHIMDDADLAGPVMFYFSFATFLLFVCCPNLASPDW